MDWVVLVLGGVESSGVVLVLGGVVLAGVVLVLGGVALVLVLLVLGGGGLGLVGLGRVLDIFRGKVQIRRGSGLPGGGVAVTGMRER